MYFEYIIRYQRISSTLSCFEQSSSTSNSRIVVYDGFTAVGTGLVEFQLQGVPGPYSVRSFTDGVLCSADKEGYFIECKTFTYVVSAASLVDVYLVSVTQTVNAVTDLQFQVCTLEYFLISTKISITFPGGVSASGYTYSVQYMSTTVTSTATVVG
jgi:hypothetical protein